MDDKVAAVRSFLLKGMPGSRVEHEHARGLHKFRIEGHAPTHWLYLSEELVEDSEPAFLVNSITKNRIIDHLNQSQKSTWLFLGHDGLRTVDEKFAK